ncbi:2695_t:CDS:2 [Entrophospora sp. SA101]|nr:2695_t:CDS:2 [Entrophospora sp. SA101]
MHNSKTLVMKSFKSDYSTRSKDVRQNVQQISQEDILGTSQEITQHFAEKLPELSNQHYRTQSPELNNQYNSGGNSSQAMTANQYSNLLAALEHLHDNYDSTINNVIICRETQVKTGRNLTV